MGTIRSFIALELPTTARQECATVLEVLRAQSPRGAISWVATENLHVTLQFLGNVEEERLGPIGDALRRAVDGMPRLPLVCSEVGSFPPRREPRVVWVGLAGAGVDPLRALYASIATALESQGFPREARPFTPHITLGRARRTAHSRALRAVAEVLRATPPPSGAPWQGEHITLMESQLGPEGPRYVPRVRLALA